MYLIKYLFMHEIYKFQFENVYSESKIYEIDSVLLNFI